MNEIEEKQSEFDSVNDEKKNDSYEEEVDEEFGRSEENLDLEHVSIVSTPKERKAKPIITQEEAKMIVALSEKREK